MTSNDAQVGQLIINLVENKEVFKQNKVNKTLNKINTNEIHFIKTIII